eukprot:986576-Rhodomonas_salina.1
MVLSGQCFMLGLRNADEVPAAGSLGTPGPTVGYLEMMWAMLSDSQEDLINRVKDGNAGQSGSAGEQIKAAARSKPFAQASGSVLYQERCCFL